MLYDPSTREPLRAWLVKTLEPICDAEPGALADYVLALLAHDAPEQELRDEFISQLEEFFERGAADFIDNLFATLRSKSYLPYSNTPNPYTPADSHSQDTGIPIPLDVLLSSTDSATTERRRKRSLEQDDRDRRRPPKGSRLSVGGDGGNWRRGVRVPPWDTMPVNGGETSDAAGFNGTNGRQINGKLGNRIMLPRGVCRDYHMKGYCSRGAMCKFSHDGDAFVPGNLPFPAAMPGAPSLFGPFMPFVGTGMPFGIGQGTSGSNVPYDPNQAHMDLRRGAIQGIQGELPVVQDLTPMPAPEDVNSMVVDPSSSNLDPPNGSAEIMHPDGRSRAFSENPSIAGQAHLRPPTGGNSAFRGAGRPRGRPRTFNGDASSNRLDNNRDNTTVVVNNIPAEQLSLEAVNGWFKRFGTVTKVAIDASGSQALVSFSRHDEAETAWKSQEAVFNNRFVKIFWHKPMDGQGVKGSRALEASAPLVANMTAHEVKFSPTTVLQVGTAVPKQHTAIPGKATSSAAVSNLAAKQQLLEKQIAEQKELFTRLTSANATEKKDIMVRLRTLGEEMKASSTVRPKSLTPTPSSDIKEQKAKDLLDAELDSHRARSESHRTETPIESNAPDGAEGQEQLQEKLAKLRAEAAALGISDTPTRPTFSPHRAYRARGRGRGSYRGNMRGRAYFGMNLDNRPKKLLLKGVRAQESDVQAAINMWYQPGGQLEKVEVAGNDGILASFKTRAAAEQALARGSTIPSIGTVKISWHNDSSTTGPTPHSSTGDGIKDASKPHENGTEERPLSPAPEEMVDETGWANEDGMGMF